MQPPQPQPQQQQQESGGGTRLWPGSPGDGPPVGMEPRPATHVLGTLPASALQQQQQQQQSAAPTDRYTYASYSQPPPAFNMYSSPHLLHPLYEASRE